MQCFAPVNPKFPQFRGWSDPPVQAIESPARPKLVPASRFVDSAVPRSTTARHPWLGCSAHGALACQLPPHRSQDSGLGSCSVNPKSSRRVVGALWRHWDGTRGQDSARQGWSWPLAPARSQPSVLPREVLVLIVTELAGGFPMLLACSFLHCLLVLVVQKGILQETRLPRPRLWPPPRAQAPAAGRWAVQYIAEPHNLPATCRSATAVVETDGQTKSTHSPLGRRSSRRDFCDSPRTPLQIEFRQQFPTGQGVRVGR